MSEEEVILLREQLKTLRLAVSDNCESIKEIRDNHLSHLRNDTGELKNRLTGVETKLAFIEKMMWIVAGASVSALLAGLINLLFK